MLNNIYLLFIFLLCLILIKYYHEIILFLVYGLTSEWGDAICNSCKKRIDGEAYTIPVDKDNFYCAKCGLIKIILSKKKLKEFSTNSNEESKPKIKNKPRSIICSKCDKSTTTSYVCSICKNEFCKRHSHPTKHKCVDKIKLTKLADTFSEKVKVSVDKSKCNLCKSKLTYFKAFRCHYCSLWHCDNHRIPEDHNCSGKLHNPHRESSIVSYSKR